MRILSVVVLFFAATFLTNVFETSREMGRVTTEPRGTAMDQTLPKQPLVFLDEQTSFSYKSLPNEPVLLSFFATWCVPCLIEYNSLIELSKRSDIPFVGIALRDKAEKVQDLIETKGNPYTMIALDRDSKWATELKTFFVPTVYLTDGKGKVVYKVEGVLTKEVYEQKLLPKIIEVKNAFSSH